MMDQTENALDRIKLLHDTYDSIFKGNQFKLTLNIVNSKVYHNYCYLFDKGLIEFNPRGGNSYECRITAKGIDLIETGVLDANTLINL